MNDAPRRPVDDGPGAPQATYVLDREGRIIETNEMIAGLPFCCLREQTGVRFTQRLDPDSARQVEKFFRRPGKHLTGKVDCCFMRGDGHYFPTFLRVQALSDAGATVGFVVIVEPAEKMDRGPVRRREP